MTGKQVDLTTCVWGEWHLDVMRRVMLPTLLSPRNLPALSRRLASRYRIATTPADRKRIEAWPIFARLAAAVEIEWITENASPDIAYHVDWYERALIDAKAKNSYCFMVYPDVAWSDGTLARCADVIAAGKVGVAMPYLRVMSETFVPDIARRGSDTAIALSGGELVRLGVRHMHPLSAATMAGGSHALPSLEVFWRVGDQGLLLRQMSRELTISRDLSNVDTERIGNNRYWHAVDIADPESLYVATDSDDMLMLSLAPLFKDFQIYIPRHTMQPMDLARVSLHPANNNPLVGYFASHQIRLHYEGIDQNRWRTFERRADRFVGQTLFTREFLRIWDAVHANGCSLASQAMSVGLVATSLARRWRHDGPVTAYIPSDDAFGNQGWDGLAPLLVPDAADDLETIILNHVAPGARSGSASGSWEQVALSGKLLCCHAGSDGEFVNDARIVRRLDVPPHRICIVDRLIAPSNRAAGPSAIAPRHDIRTEMWERGSDTSDTSATAKFRKNKKLPLMLLRGNFAKVARKVRAAASAVAAKFPTGSPYVAVVRSHSGTVDLARDEGIARHYPTFLRHFAVELGAMTVNQQIRAATAALYQAGLYRHKLLFVHDLMSGFSATAGLREPRPAFFDYCASLIGDERDLMQAERYYRLALQLVPDFAEALYALALLKRRAGVTAEAVTLFEAAARALPHPNAVPHAHIAANSWRNLAEIYRDVGNDELAEACFRKALDHFGNHGVYQAEIAEFLRARGRIAEAARQYQLLMPYSHLYPSEFSEPNFPPQDRLPLARTGHPCDPLTPTIAGEGANGARLVYWWHVYLLLPWQAPLDIGSLIRMKPQMRPAANTSAALIGRHVNPS
jgi:tetratricopeptide (TPR) repeat protein